VALDNELHFGFILLVEIHWTTELITKSLKENTPTRQHRKKRDF